MLLLLSLCFSPVLGNYFDLPNNTLVELLKVFGRNPILLMSTATDKMGFVIGEKVSVNLKPRDVADLVVIVLCVPIPRDLRRVFFVENRVEDWLLREPWRESGKTTFFDQRKFFFSDRSEQGDGLNHDPYSRQ